MKPVCVKCQCFYRPEQNGYMFMEMMPNHLANDKYPHEYRGTKAPDHWQPYKLWRGDLWECPECQHQIVVGVAPRPMAEHYEEDFNERVERWAPQVQVNDC